jgi:hypothetical protein
MPPVSALDLQLCPTICERLSPPGIQNLGDTVPHA